MSNRLPNWQPMSTAPKDGSVIWAYHPNGAIGGLEPACYAVFWNSVRGVWEPFTCYGVAEGSTGFTKWCCLPEPPDA